MTFGHLSSIENYSPYQRKKPLNHLTFGLKYDIVVGMASDAYMWQTDADMARDNATEKHYQFFSDGMPVGRAATRVLRHAFAFREQQQFFPASWFQGNAGVIGGYYSVARLKPILNITCYNFKNYRGVGYGRAGLQKLYLLSRRLGCDGRIVLTATNNAGGFYEHCGFQGLKAGNDGEKYFDPQCQTLKKLFQRNHIRNFTIQEIPSADQIRKVPLSDKTGIYARLQKVIACMERI